jgi:thioredoxin 1
VVLELTDATFEQEVLQTERPVVVDFWAPWCGPCRAVEPVLRQLEDEHGERVTFARLDIDENLQTASRYDVLSIPTVILFEGGEPRETVVGARPRSHYAQAWAQWLSPTSATP